MTQESATGGDHADGANRDEIERWNAVGGQTWATLADTLDAMVGPLGEAAMDRLGPAPGESLIDVGCGCGATSLALATRVGDAGAVLGVDVSGPMLEVAKARARAARANQASFLRADAQTHAFAAGAADAVFSRFGVMFFDDPAGAFANLRQGVRAGGRLGFLCWRAMVLNPMMGLAVQAALPLLPTPPPPPEPTAPGPFAFADPDRVRALLSAAGWSGIETAAHDAPISVGDAEATADLNLRIGPLGTLVRETPALGERVRDAVRAAYATFERDGRVVMDSATWIVSARKG